MNSLVEATLLNVCYNQAIVDFTKTIRLGEFVNHAGSGYFHLTVLAPECVLPEPGRLGSPPIEEVAQAVWTIKKQRSEPVIVLSTSAEEQFRLFESGADAAVHSTPFAADEFGAAARRLLHLPQPLNEERAATWSLAGLFLRGLHRLKKA
jgi:hypothetical protein